jgi:hypothetical protein
MLGSRVARLHIFQTKNLFFRVLQWKMLVYFIAIWSTRLRLGIFCGHLIYLWLFGMYFSRFGMLYQEKSGNPAPEERRSFASSV